jgi:hypothetical protein
MGHGESFFGLNYCISLEIFSLPISGVLLSPSQEIFSRFSFMCFSFNVLAVCPLFCLGTLVM